jgi:hypothetical protein
MIPPGACHVLNRVLQAAEAGDVDVPIGAAKYVIKALQRRLTRTFPTEPEWKGREPPNCWEGIKAYLTTEKTVGEFLILSVPAGGGCMQVLSGLSCGLGWLTPVVLWLMQRHVHSMYGVISSA